MSPDPESGTARRPLTALDDRIEFVTGHNVDTLWAHRDRAVLDGPHALLVDRHRVLAQAETGVTFYRTLLHRLAGGEFPVDSALLGRIDRTVDQLRAAVDARDTANEATLAALRPIEASARSAPSAEADRFTAADQAALLAIAGGAKLYQHLLTGRTSVTTASGTRIPHAELQRLEAAGLVIRDTSHPVHAGQPVTLTKAGRAALTAGRSPQSSEATKPAQRPGARPSPPRHRR